MIHTTNVTHIFSYVKIILKKFQTRVIIINMKRFLLLISGILLSCNLCLGAYLPTSVYIEDHPQKANVQKAFAVWQAAGDNVIKFRFVNSRAQIPNITVVFSNSTYRETYAANAVGLASTSARNMHGSSAKATITIWLKGPDGRTLSEKELYHVALHEIGHTLGLGHTNNKTDIMYPIVNEQTTLSANDIARFKQIFSQ